MKELFDKNKKILMFVGIFAAVFLVYTLFIKKEPQGDLTRTAASSTVAAVQDNRELLSQLQALNAVTLNAEIFSSQLFNLLQDNTVIIENRKPEGRRNPFLPIGYDSGSFVPDQKIINATNNTNGLLNPVSGGAQPQNIVLTNNAVQTSSSTTKPVVPATTTKKITN